MNRQQVTAEELIATLNERLAQYEDCEGCYIECAAVPLSEPEDEGCNWSPKVIISGGATEACQRIAVRLVEQATDEYDVNW